MEDLLISSVIRSSHQTESHGGLYRVNFGDNSKRQLLDWNDKAINWEGRGADRGLRGIAFESNQVWIAASDELFLFDSKFTILGRYRSHVLKHCHEICIADGKLYLTSTGFDSILEFSLDDRVFLRGWCFRKHMGLGGLTRRLGMDSIASPRGFNLQDDDAEPWLPEAGDTLHLNSVHPAGRGTISVAGTNSRSIVVLDPATGEAGEYGKIQRGTHNARIVEGGKLLFNDTRNDQIRLTSERNNVIKSFKLPQLDSRRFVNSDLPNDHARPYFSRGLVLAGDRIYAGMSPATINCWDRTTTELLCSINLTNDVRNAVHGLEVVPVSWPS